MDTGTFNLAELADAAGVSGRTVRYYIQEGLLIPPGGVGRGKHYGAEHLERLRRILDLQRAGHSLLAIRQVLDGKPAPQPERPPRAVNGLRSELVTRLELAPGVELSFDARHAPPAEGLLALRDLARRVFGS
jgi:DNA-binding transcriptional MerR regulator